MRLSRRLTLGLITGVVIGVLLLATALSLHFADLGTAIRIETVVPPGLPAGYKHAPSACELPGGDLLLVYCCGTNEYARDPAIWATRWDHRTDKWDLPRIIAADPQKANANPTIWRAPNDCLWLFYVVRHGSTWSTATIRCKQSTDNGNTWRQVALPFADEPMMTRCRPIALSNGDYLLPVYHEAGTDTEFLPPDTCSFFLRYDLSTQQWIRTPNIRSRLGNLQPSVAEVGERYVVAYCRRGGGYSGDEEGFIIRSESHDGGLTWSEGRDSAFPNPNSAVDFIRLKNGHLILAYNNSHVFRSPLAVAVSVDGDQSYPFKRDIVSGGLLDFAYPCLLQTSDGLIHLFFSAEGRTFIQHAVFTERDITGNDN